jgi:ribosomal protein L17
MVEIKLKSDKYKKARGGYSRLLNISCAKCGQHLCFYQKDGPGILKRMYTDRIFDPTFTTTCQKCKQLLGVNYIYEKENRPAFRLFIDAVSKKIVKSK